MPPTCSVPGLSKSITAAGPGDYGLDLPGEILLELRSAQKCTMHRAVDI